MSLDKATEIELKVSKVCGLDRGLGQRVLEHEGHPKPGKAGWDAGVAPVVYMVTGRSVVGCGGRRGEGHADEDGCKQREGEGTFGQGWNGEGAISAAVVDCLVRVGRTSV